MSATVIDTSVWIEYFDGPDRFQVEELLEAGLVYLPPIVISELLSAKMAPRQRAELMAFLLALPLCATPFEHWARVGDLRAKMSRLGTAVSVPDAHIAQCCLDLNAVLLSTDRVFKRVAEVEPLRCQE